VERPFDRTKERLGAVDILVNNAGIQKDTADVVDTDLIEP
jgi:NAD(P)-dependent dehydrogenase (short-subunit alcohol dehydrogenase family)